ncbi:helix-turn-helix domain-containing protein [Dactylosporangium maewongense]|uniref:Helix-turn-helix domain-containing protein n=1 Tax=Dactylosporangium maewongense TaxID=634393 RepID=A0ABN2DHL1_9ACTN
MVNRRHPASPVPASAARLLRPLAGALLNDLDRLTDELVVDIQQHGLLYATEARVTRADLWATSHANVRRILQLLAGSVPTGTDPLDAPRDTGRRRAEQGMPLEAVLQAFRRGGRVVWHAMVEHARNTPDVNHDTLLDCATAIWEVIDRQSSAVAVEYRLTEMELHKRDATRREALFEALLDGHGDNSTVLQAAATAIGIPITDRYLVAVAVHDPANVPALPTPSFALRAIGVWSYWRARPHAHIGLIRMCGRPVDEIISALRTLPGRTIGLSPELSSLAALGEGRSLAEHALRTIPTGRPDVAWLDERLPEALLCDAPAIASRLVDRYLAPILQAPEGESRQLLHTLQTWLDCGGSAGRAATILFCHRNTVLNRLSRIESLTNRSTDSGRDRMGWALALQALPLLTTLGTPSDQPTYPPSSLPDTMPSASTPA